MHAAVYYQPGPPNVLRYEEVPDPVVKPGQVGFRVEAVSVEGGDLLHRGAAPVPSPPNPHIVGYQAAGTVDQIGDGVDTIHPGQRIVAFMWSGSHASRAV